LDEEQGWFGEVIARAVRLWEHGGIECAVLRSPMWEAFTGYVRVPEDHPWRSYEAHSEIPAEVHGGLTFGPQLSYEFAGRLVPARTWAECEGWIGFDTMHGWDLMLDRMPDVVSNKTREYVEAECERLADQVVLARVEPRAGIEPE
jgi:hypothetical protein